MKLYIVLLVLVILPGAYAFDRYVTFKIDSLKYKSNTDILIQPNQGAMVDKWEFCFADVLENEDVCTWVVGNLTQDWAMTLGPFNGPDWNVGTQHLAIIRIKGDDLDTTPDLKLFTRGPPATTRAWKSARINTAHCSLKASGNDLAGAQDGLFFSASTDNDGAATAGWGDVDDCSGGEIVWKIPFTVTT
jgi:hypothetical protein